MPLSKIQLSSSTGRRNLIINGAMKVAQRGDQASITNAYTGVDRWKFDRSGAAVVTGKQGGSGVSTPENGFPNSVHIDVTTADSSVAAGDFGLLRQYIESQNLQSLQFGTSAAKSLTLSFWVKSPKTGTHWVEIYAYDAAKFNSASYTVSSANTWEKKTVTFAGETSTVIPNDNTHGFVVNWWLMAGSNYSSGTHAGNVWHATDANRLSGQVNVLDNTSNNFYLTGVQLEAGNAATEFEHLSFGEELSLCHRYYERFGQGWWARFETGSQLVVNGQFKVEKRIAPTIGLPVGGTIRLYEWGVSDRDTSPSLTSTSMAANGGHFKLSGFSTGGSTGEIWGVGGTPSDFSTHPFDASSEL